MSITMNWFYENADSQAYDAMVEEFQNAKNKMAYCESEIAMAYNAVAELSDPESDHNIADDLDTSELYDILDAA